MMGRSFSVKVQVMPWGMSSVVGRYTHSFGISS